MITVMCRKRLDIRDTFPSGVEEYLSLNGWHFNKALCMFAVSRMKKRPDASGKTASITPWDKEKTEEFLSRFGIDTSEFIGYDHVYVINMARADYYGSSVADDQRLALFVRDYLQDPDGYDEVAMTRYYADCIGKGEIIPWEDCI